MYAVYLVKYKGDKLPPYYIGSTTIKKLDNGYRGSVKSKKYKKIFKKELIENPHLFEYEILSKHKDRREALNYELEEQKKCDVVKSDLYFNMSFASVNGMFGMDVSGDLNPMYGKTKEVVAINILTNEKVRVTKEEFDLNVNLSGHTLGIINVYDENGKIIRINKNDFSLIKHKHINTGRKHTDKLKNKLSKMRKGFITAKDWSGNFHRVNKYDKRFKNGEFGNTTSKRWIITNSDGDEFKTFNFVKFFKDNGLQRPNKNNIGPDGVITFLGRPYKLKSTNGWKVKCLD